MKQKSLRARVLVSGPALLGFSGFSLLAGCQKETESLPPLDAEVAALQASDNAAAVFTSAALSAQGNTGAAKAGGHVSSGFGSIGRSFSNIPLDTGSGGSATAPYVRHRSPLKFTLLSVPAFRALARPLATESLLGPSRVGGEFGALAATSTATGDSDTSELASDLDDTGQALRRLLRERIFVAANLESKTGTEAIYRLRPDPTCRDLDDDHIDASCEKNLNKVELRVRLTKDVAGGAHIDILVGSERAFPVRLIIDPNQLATELYLGEIKRTSAILATALGETDDTPDVFKGTVRFALTKEAEKTVSFASAILEMVEVENQGSSDPGTFRSAASDPIWKLTADGDKGTITGAIGLGATEFMGSWDPKDTGAKNKDLHVVMAGLKGQITFTQASSDVKLTGLGFGPGPSFVEAHGQRIFQLDLNEQGGRAFDLGITFDAQDKPIFAVTPRFDLQLGMHFGLVASDFTSPPAAHLLDETYRFTLDPAAAATPVFVPWQSTTSDTSGLKLTAGSLSFGSSKATAPVVVNAGQCLIARQPLPGDHPVIGALQASDCK
jgi:hypothetical protein